MEDYSDRVNTIFLIFLRLLVSMRSCQRNIIHIYNMAAGRTFVRLAVLLCPLLFAVPSQSVMAQNEAQTSMYWATPTLYNPAAAGSDSALHVTAFDRMQWVGVEGAPHTFFVSADAPLRIMRKRVGLGLSVLNDQAGLFKTTYVNAQINYSLSLWGGRLALGLQPGFVNQSFSGGDVYIPSGDAWDSSDPSIPRSDVSGKAFDLGLGAYYEWGKWYGGIGVQHLNAAELELADYAYSQLEKTLYFHAGGNILLKRTLFILQPSVLVKTTFQFTQYDFTLRALWNHKFWGGVSYRPSDAVVLMVGADIGSVRLGYAYDIGISRFGMASGGSHEILAGWTMPIELEKKNKHGHKSIRIL